MQIRTGEIVLCAPPQFHHLWVLHLLAQNL